MEAVTTQWQRIEAHLLTLPHLPQPFLKPGATDEEIATAEAATGGFLFPEDFRSSLKRHNGQATYHVLLGIGALLSTQEIVEQWSVWQELLDSGTVGQVVQMWHDEGNRPLQAKSFLAWLTECAEKLEDGRLVWEDEEEGFRFVDAKESGQGGAQDEHRS